MDPLSTNESVQLINALAPTGMPEAMIEATVDAAAGNPLFIEQQVAAATDDPGVLVYPDLHTLLAARIDRLPATERAIVEYASVHYDVFSPRSLTPLLPVDLRRSLRVHLRRLVRSRLLTATGPAPSADLRFAHLLVRDAAYAEASAKVVADAHERLARWLCDHAEGHPQDWDAVAGYHLEQAYRVSAALGEPNAAALGEDAAGLLEHAGRRALARVNYRGDAAPDLLGRAVSLLPMRDPRYSELLPMYVAALSEGAKPELAAKVIANGLKAAEESADRRLAARLQSEDAWLRFHVDSATKFSDALTQAGRAVHALQSLGAGRALARAQYVHGTLLFCVGSSEAALGPLESCMALARETGDRRTEVDAIWQLAGPIFWGPTPVNEAGPRCRELRRSLPYASQPYAFMVVLDAIFLAMAGRFNEARDVAERGAVMYNDLGITPADVGLPQYSARLSLLLGDVKAAVDGLRGACASYARRGDTGYVSSTAGLLGEALYRQERYDEALEAADLARSTAAADDFGAQMIWRWVRAKVVARRGDHAEARSLARQAVSIGRPTELSHQTRGRTARPVRGATAGRQCRCDAKGCPSGPGIVRPQGRNSVRAGYGQSDRRSARAVMWPSAGWQSAEQSARCVGVESSTLCLVHQPQELIQVTP